MARPSLMELSVVSLPSCRRVLASKSKCLSKNKEAQSKTGSPNDIQLKEPKGLNSFPCQNDLYKASKAAHPNVKAANNMIPCSS